MGNNTTEVYTLDELNSEIRRKLLAPLIYLLLLAVIGIPGNFFVIIIFRTYKRNVYRTLILNMAIIDFSFCLIGIPFNIIRILYYYTFKVTRVCQIFAGMLDFGIMSSTHLLMLMAVHRYRQIFMPLKSQINTENVKYFIATSLIIGVALATPQIAVLQPLEKVQFQNNITGSICAVTWKDSPYYWKVYNFFLSGLFVTYAFVLFFIYGRIGRKIIVRRIWRSKQRASSCNGKPSDVSNRMTKIAFAVSAVFILSYLPLYINEELAKIVNASELSPVQFAVFKIIERSYIMNHVANPFVYACFDVRFRSKLWEILKSCRQNGIRKENENSKLSLDNVYTVRTSSTRTTNFS
ncbi:unnamed protein product [Mytilus coruscus]|uniref:G-protein coupled receptors family 1 profile domain-containing protein n=1 Tax=Mytilus coruscus TaxID=42192 RepID=A0A6J8AW65_MYTCO|nr:unnamed protein product [Mytilus coruscus]